MNVRSCLFVVLAVLFAVSAASAQSTLLVCASDCPYTDLQDAIDAAQPGDTISLMSGETFTGNFTLPDKGSSTEYITLTSNAGVLVVPGDGERVNPDHAIYMPKIRSGNSSPALTVEPGAHHYRLQFLELQGNFRGFNEILALGGSGSGQNSLSLVPHHLIVDRVYVHGDPWFGQKRCIGLNSAHTTIVNSYVSDCKGIGQDAQAIGGFNGPGPYLIENNYLEGAGENVLFGGSDPSISGLIPTGITFRNNYLSKPLSWRDPILGTPQASASGSTSGGTLAAGTYSYRVEARGIGYNGTTVRSAGSTEVAAAVASGSAGSVTVTWPAVPNATEYRVFGRAQGAPTLYWTVTGTSFTDTGSGGTSAAGALPGSGTKWTVKNTFELKNAQDVLVTGNIIERSWLHAQTGFIVVLTTANQDGACTWCVVDDVEISYNIVRHGAGGVNILATDADGEPSGRTSRISIHDNLFYDINADWGSTLPLFQVGQGPGEVIIDHNTTDHPNKSQFDAYGPGQTGNLVFTNNLMQRGTYGILGFSASEGTAALNASATAWTFLKNTIAEGTSSRYPANNFFPALADWKAQFADYDNHDFHLDATSPYKNAGTDGKDLGADMAALDLATSGVLTGTGRWLTADVGTVGVAGSTTKEGDTFTLEAGGTDIWDTADAFHFVYRQLTGDGEIVARIADLSVPSGAAWSLGAVTFRQDLSPGSLHASMMITSDGKAKFRRRTTVGGTTASDGPSAGTTFPPRWVKLTRVGNQFTAAISSDGVTWTQVHTPQDVFMGPTVLVGMLALRNGASAPGATAVFEDVKVDDVPTPWRFAAVGDPADLAVPGSAGYVDGVFTLKGSGTDVWDTGDDFHFLYQRLVGDGEIVAQVQGLTVPTGASWSLAGVTMRENFAPGSRHATMMITSDGKAKFRRRTSTDGTTASDGPSTGTTFPPRWLKLTRSGNTFTAAISSDGVTWTQVHTPQTVTMPPEVVVGLIALRNGSGAGAATATFGNVSIIP